MKKMLIPIVVSFLCLFADARSMGFLSSSGGNEAHGPDVSDLDFSTINFDDLAIPENTIDVEDSSRSVVISQDASIQGIALFLREYVKNPLWAKTYAPAGRNVLYLMPHATTKKESFFNAHFFYNQTGRMKVTVDDFIPHGAIGSEGEILELLAQKIKDPNDRAALFPLFRKISLQERRIGTSLQACYVRSNLVAQIQTSMYISEKNFYLGSTNRNRLLKIFNVRLSDLPLKEFYKIRAGLGDTKISLGAKPINTESFQMCAGGEVIIPSSRFSYAPSDEADIEKIGTASNMEEFGQSMIAMMRNIRNYLIGPRFGNDGHFGFGGYLETATQFPREKIELWGRLSFHQFFSANENRLFMLKQTLSPDDVKADSSMATVSNYLKQYVFPSAFNVLVQPGDIFNCVVAVNRPIDNVLMTFGYDFYVQQKEHFSRVNKSQVSLKELKISSALVPQVAQHKIFLHGMYKKRPHVDIGLGGDSTVLSSGMGKDWTIYVTFNGSF